MITVWGMAMSGNCWKAAQILNLTGHPFEWVETDSNAGATRTPDFLAINPNGKVPAMRLDDGTVITESNAILLHFAEGTPWLPPPGLKRTRVMEWLFFEQYSHEPYIAVARNILLPWISGCATHSSWTKNERSSTWAPAPVNSRAGCWPPAPTSSPSSPYRRCWPN